MKVHTFESKIWLRAIFNYRSRNLTELFAVAKHA